MEFVVAYFKRMSILKIDFRCNRKNCHNRYMRFNSAKNMGSQRFTMFARTLFFGSRSGKKAHTRPRTHKYERQRAKAISESCLSLEKCLCRLRNSIFSERIWWEMKWAREKQRSVQRNIFQQIENARRRNYRWLLFDKTTKQEEKSSNKMMKRVRKWREIGMRMGRGVGSVRGMRNRKTVSVRDIYNKPQQWAKHSSNCPIDKFPSH